MAKIEISDRDWNMADWPAQEIVVEGVVMALEGCGRDESPVQVLSSDGTPLRILGVRRADPDGNSALAGSRPSSWRVQLVVEAPPQEPSQPDHPRLDGCTCPSRYPLPVSHKPPCQWAN